MKKNRKGQVMMLTLMLAVACMFLLLAFAPAIKSFVDVARNSSNGDQVGLDCDNSTISDFDKGACVTVDLYNPYFIGIALGICGALVGAKVLSQ